MDMNEMLFKSNLHGYLETEFEEKFYNFFIGKGFSKRRLMRNFKDYFECVESPNHEYRIIPKDYIDHSVIIEHSEHTGRIVTSLDNLEYREGNLYFKFLDKEYPIVPSHYEGYNFIEMRDVFIGLSKLGKVTQLHNINSVPELECGRLRILFSNHKFILVDNGTQINVNFGNLTISNKITARACELIIEIEKEMFAF